MFTWKLFRNLNHLFLCYLARTDYFKAVTCKISGVLRPLSPGIGYIIIYWVYIHWMCLLLFFCLFVIVIAFPKNKQKQTKTKHLLDQCLSHACWFSIIIRWLFSKDLCEPSRCQHTEMQKHRSRTTLQNEHQWPYRECSMKCNLDLLRNSLMYNVYFQFWDKMRLYMAAGEHHASFMVLPFNQMKFSDFDWFSFCIFTFLWPRNSKWTLKKG